MTPTCPPHYDCTFTPKNPPHYYAHWWDGEAGIVVAVLGVIAVLVLLWVLIEAVRDVRQDRSTHEAEGDRRRAEATEAREKRAFDLAVEEQRTMQLDAAKGDPDMLRIVRDLQRTPR